MKKTYVILFVLLCCAISSHAQKEASIWYFGHNAGLDFNSGAPIVLTDGQLDTGEGCATISDFNGNLLFYTDGVTIWNRNHTSMPNGMGLNGHPSSTQSGIIVPFPGDLTRYYVFTVDEGAYTQGLQYNIVDMNLDGGLGDVTSKNILLETPVLEKLTAVEHANGTDIWVMAHRYNSNEYIAYLVTTTGVVATPVVSAIGPLSNNQNHIAGYLKFSPNGETLAAGSSLGNYLHLFQFDNATGTLSNFLDMSSFYSTLAGTRITQVYGIEFSSDSSKLYTTSTIVLNFPILNFNLYQFDLSNYNIPAITASATLLANQSTDLSAMQLAIDGKIYVSQYEQDYLGVITDPNILGAGAGYVQNAVYLGGRKASLGLPPFIQSYFVIGLQAQNFCLGDATAFTLTTSDPVTSISWDFGDGNTSTLEHPTNTYATAGTYTVSVTATTASETKTETKEITIYQTPTANAMTSFEICSTTTNYQFDLNTKDTEVLGAQVATEHIIDYYPSLADANAGTNLLPTPYTNTNATETIFARISNVNNPSCYATTSFDLVVKQAPILHTIADWVACDTDSDGLYDFDLSQKDGEVYSGQDTSVFSIRYFETQANADAGLNAIAPNYTNTATRQTLYFRIENRAYPECYETGSFRLEVVPQVLAQTPSAVEVCDDNTDGVSSFDLSSKDAEILGVQPPSDFEVSYHSSQNDAHTDSNPLNKTSYSNTTPYQETVYARVQSTSNPQCYQTTSFALNVFDTPTLGVVTNWAVCDADNDGIFSFDLTEKDAAILGTQSDSRFRVSYHLTAQDAGLDQNAISGNFQNATNPQRIHFRLESIGRPECYVTESFELQVFDTPTANMPSRLNACDVNESGIRTLDLSQKDAEVWGGQNTATYSVSYFTTEAEATTNSNPLSKTAYMNTALQETIYARIQNNANPECFAISSFDIRISPLPQPNLQAEYVICPDSPELQLDGGGFERWSWRDENGLEISTDRSITIETLGNYTLTVFRTENGLRCENTVDFEVISSGAPEDFTTEIGDFSDVVSITVNVTGTGNFEYSADGETYQDGNRLEVFPGIHTIYVRDTYLCRTISKEVVALGYQKFFTPNNDTINEYWNIIGADLYPDSKLFIYDRYGRLLKQLDPDGLGWDGTFNGLQMPSSDYWFHYFYGDGKEFSGHFSLKR